MNRKLKYFFVSVFSIQVYKISCVLHVNKALQWYQKLSNVVTLSSLSIQNGMTSLPVKCFKDRTAHSESKFKGTALACLLPDHAPLTRFTLQGLNVEVGVTYHFQGFMHHDLP